MRHQIVDCDVCFTVLRKLWNIFRDRVVQLHLALIDELHHRGRGCHHFCQRREIENRVHCHGRVRRLKRALAVSLAIDHLAVMADEEYCAGDFMSLDGGVDDGVKTGKIGCFSLLRPCRRAREERCNAYRSWDPRNCGK